MVVVALRRAEDLVRGVDLTRVQNPLAVEAEGGGASGHPLVAVDVADLQERPVDGLLVVRAGGHEDAHEDVVVRVALGVARRLLAHDQGLHVDRRHEVGRAEDDRLDTRRGLRDPVDVDQPERVLDLRLDADAAHRKAVRLLDLGDEQVEGHHLLGRLNLRQHDAVEVRPGPLDDGDDVVVGPVRGPVVHPYDAGLAAPVTLVERGHDVVAGALFRDRCHGVLQVEEDLVGRQALGLAEHLHVRAGHCQARAAQAQRPGGCGRVGTGSHTWGHGRQR